MQNAASDEYLKKIFRKFSVETVLRFKLGSFG